MRTGKYNSVYAYFSFLTVREAERGIFMKFAKGDLIVYGETGVCKVEDVVTRVFLDVEQLCYKLCPIYTSCIIFTPVEGGNAFMRPIITRDSAEALISSVSVITPNDVIAASPRELSQKHDLVIKSHDCAEWLNLVVSIRAKKEIAVANKKKISTIDERYAKKAADLLYGELAAALGVTKADIALRFEEEFNK